MLLCTLSDVFPLGVSTMRPGLKVYSPFERTIEDAPTIFACELAPPLITATFGRLWARKHFMQMQVRIGIWIGDARVHKRCHLVVRKRIAGVNTQRITLANVHCRLKNSVAP